MFHISSPHMDIKCPTKRHQLKIESATMHNSHALMYYFFEIVACPGNHESQKSLQRSVMHKSATNDVVQCMMFL